MLGILLVIWLQCINLQDADFKVLAKSPLNFIYSVKCFMFFFLYQYIVIFYRGEIKLADFGLARLYEADERLAFIYIEFLLRSN